MQVSLVVPVYEDRSELRRCLASWDGVDELLVVDASRRDPIRLTDLPKEGRLIRAGKASRSGQLNLGAELARKEVFLFLHADTALAPGGLAALRRAMAEPDVVGGGFERTFDSGSRLLAWSCCGASWRSRCFGLFFGDQGIFVRRALFYALGGFPDRETFEDWEFCRRLRSAGRLACLRPPVHSSARRFARDGVARRIALDLLASLRYLSVGTEEGGGPN